MRLTVGDDFQEATKYTRKTEFSRGLNWANKPETYKVYSLIKAEPLPTATIKSTTNFTEILKRRRSTRAFSSKPLTKLELAFLLWASTCVHRVEEGYEFRTAPSAGALYPIETYIAINKADDLETRIYHYNIKDHLLEELKSVHFGLELVHVTFRPIDVCNCACSLHLDSGLW
jgi:hypothetical protein